jgi:multidrug efflux pump subunit AcrA (membrane-fusion protein)
MSTPKIRPPRPTALKTFILLALAAGYLCRCPARLGAEEPAPESKTAGETTTLLKARATAAEKAYRGEVAGLTQTRRVGNTLFPVTRSPEDVYVWSVRWLNAQRELSPKHEDQVAALQDHLKRMTALKTTVKQLSRDLLPHFKEDEAEWYRLEAELWLAKAKRKRSAARLIRPQQRTVTATIGQPSFVEPYERTSIYPKVAGYIEKWNVDIGDKVKKGDVLATILAPELREKWESRKAAVKLNQQRVELARKAVATAQADVKVAEPRLAEARATLSKAQATVDRWETEVKRLRREVEKKVVDPQVLLESENQLRASAAALEAARAAVLRAEAELLAKRAAEAEAELAVKVAGANLTLAEVEARRQAILVGYLTLTAPYDGIIVARNVNTFDYVAPGKGAPIYLIDRTATVRVFIDIPEKDAGSARVGTKAEVLIPALRDQPISASVTRTSWALNVKNRTLRAEIDLPNARGEILPGMYAYGKVFIERPGVPSP